MDKKHIAFEGLWLLITSLVILIFMLPIYNLVGESYPFYFDNAAVIFIAITFIRYIFLLKHHWITYSNWLKGVLMFLSIPVFIYLMDVLYDFQALYDEDGIGSIMEHLPFNSQKNVGLFIRSQMIFFWVAAFIANAMLPFRMLISIWRKVNKGTH